MDRPLHAIGRIGKPWGHQGELTLQLDGVEPDQLPPNGWLFVELDGQQVPFRYDRLRDKGRIGVLVKFHELDDPQHTGFLVGSTILVESSTLPPKESTPPVDELIGVQVHDEVYGNLGQVSAIEGTDENPVLVVHQATQEVLVPLAADLIVDFDQERKILHVRTPPGLVDMYRAG